MTAKHDWTLPEDGGEHVPEHFTLGCVGCDGLAEPEEDDDFYDDEEDDEDAPSPLEVTFATQWCFECSRRIDLAGWLDEHLDRVLWAFDEMLGTAVMIRERIGNPELDERIETQVNEVAEYVLGQFDSFVKAHAGTE